ncbi:MAG: hypothetical protein QW220_02340, partial [Candidatus Bathyarchaeia archaeon]
LKSYSRILATRDLFIASHGDLGFVIKPRRSVRKPVPGFALFFGLPSPSEPFLFAYERRTYSQSSNILPNH